MQSNEAEVQIDLGFATHQRAAPSPELLFAIAVSVILQSNRLLDLDKENLRKMGSVLLRTTERVE